MKWAIALATGHSCLFWNGQVFTMEERLAARFWSKDLAEHVLVKFFKKDEPEDPEDAEFKRRLYVQAVA